MTEFTDPSRLDRAWKQTNIPIVLRRERGQLRVRIPFRPDNPVWIQTNGKSTATWNRTERYWEIPATWFNTFVNNALKRYGSLYVVQPYREQEICATACLNAKGHECQCSCMGANHGAGNDGSWFEVSETFAVRTTKRALACRLMVLR